LVWFEIHDLLIKKSTSRLPAVFHADKRDREILQLEGIDIIRFGTAPAGQSGLQHLF